MIVLKVEGVDKTYANHKALDNVSIDVPEGAVYGLLGPNGAGKTTLIRIITQVTAPDAGKLFFKGKPLAPEDVDRIGYLPEERGLYKKMKVEEQALYLARLKGVSRGDAVARLRRWFEKFEIESWRDKKVEELSKGMAQKLQFITTVIHEPELLVFDEPFSGFDPINAEIVKREIVNLGKKGTTIIFSTHNMASVEETCTHIALINKSRKVVEGPINKIREEHANNTYRLTCRRAPGFDPRSIAGNEFAILSERLEEELLEIVLQQQAPCPPNTLLDRVLPAAEVIAYQKIVPGMNEIFIHLTRNS